MKKNVFQDGQTILIGGISDAGYSQFWLKQLEESNVKDLTVVMIESNEEAGYGDISRLVINHQVSNLLISHSGSLLDNIEDILGIEQEEAEKYLEPINIKIYPMDLLSQKIQAGANGIKGVVTNPDVMRFVTDNPNFESTIRHSEELGDYILEPAINADVGIILADFADPYGNLSWNATTFNSGDVARASDVVLAEVSEVFSNALNVDTIQLEHIWVSAIYSQATKEITENFKPATAKIETPSFNREKLKERIAEKALDYIPELSSDVEKIKALKNGGEYVRGERSEKQGDAGAVRPKTAVVNLGYGIPSFFMIEPVASVAEVQMESAVLGVLDTEGTVTGHNDPGGQLVNLVPGGVVSKTVADSFSMINRGKIDMTVLGAYQVAENGDIANWALSATDRAGVGGAVALTQNARSVLVTMIEHKRSGESKLVEELTLPATAQNVVDIVVTDQGVYAPTGTGFRRIEHFDEETKEWIKD